jgi:hypothetical protein
LRPLEQTDGAKAIAYAEKYIDDKEGLCIASSAACTGLSAQPKRQKWRYNGVSLASSATCTELSG